MGQDYEIVVVRRGEIGVNFLNRQFGPDVWTGDVNSMADPSRLLSKLWVGPAKLLNPLVRFGERMSGYYRMDRNSPVVGRIAQASHELLGEHVDGVLMPWDGKHSLESNWPNEDSGWMVDVFNASIPDFDWERFDDWIDQVLSTRDPRYLLEAPLCTAAPETAPAVKQECVVGEQLCVPVSVPKDKEEADAPRPSPSLWADEVDNAESSLPQCVEQADEVVPVVKPRGAKSESRAAGPKKFSDPREWAPPKAWEQETPEQFEARLKAWGSKRLSVAKRLGVTLPAPPKEGVRKQ